ncbi:family 16 glycosylhydrolase [Flavihumibacter stibioxidans]|nr:family 16 glycosylhydrolase [Flavihumibacter stibioxidans]
MNIIIAGMYLLIAAGCSKSNDNGGTDTAPGQLTISSTVSADGSGSVSFEAKANNTTSYFYELGNGETATAPDGKLTYQYSKPGTNTYVVTVKASNEAGQSITKSTQVTVSVTPSGSGLIWSDEFDNNGAPDPAKWVYDIGNGANGWGNNELQYYTNRSENVSVQNGVLKITARKENFSGSNFTSTRLKSKGKFEFKYGRVEASAKLPTGVGTWPAIWMLGANIDAVGWPACGEIDIMEHLGRDLNNIYGTFHYPGRSGGNADGNTRVIQNATTAFHKYSLDWKPDVIRIYVDDQLIHSLNNSASVPFNHDFFLLINLAIGGNFAGAVDPALENASLEVDYIRVYRD